MFAPYKHSDLETKPRTYTPDLDGLVAWLSEQDGATEYDHMSTRDCLLCRFVSAVRGVSHDPFEDKWREVCSFIREASGADEEFSCWRAAAEGDNTYAAALTRAINLRNGGR